MFSGVRVLFCIIVLVVADIVTVIVITVIVIVIVVILSLSLLSVLRLVVCFGNATANLRTDDITSIAFVICFVACLFYCCECFDVFCNCYCC